MNKEGKPDEVTPEERKHLEERFGSNLKDDADVQAVARQFDATRKRIREIEARARKNQNPDEDPRASE